MLIAKHLSSTLLVGFVVQALASPESPAKPYLDSGRYLDEPWTTALKIKPADEARWERSVERIEKQCLHATAVEAEDADALCKTAQQARTNLMNTPDPYQPLHLASDENRDFTLESVKWTVMATSFPYPEHLSDAEPGIEPVMTPWQGSSILQILRRQQTPKVTASWRAIRILDLTKQPGRV